MNDAKTIVFLISLPVVIFLAVLLGMDQSEKCSKLRQGCENDIASDCIDYEYKCVRPAYEYRSMTYE